MISSTSWESYLYSVLPNNALLVILDVASLCTNIPHQESIIACEEALNSRDNLSPPTDNHCHLIKLILSTNVFTFNKEYYLQVQGTVMGTCIAPSYANLFMANLEREFLHTQDKLPLVWCRYIDDIFAVWTHGEEFLCLFVENLNPCHTIIKFTAIWSSEEITFLDTPVYVKNGQLETNLRVKPTKTHRYFQANHCHYKHYKTAVSYRQNPHLHRICFKQDHLQQRCQELKHHLIKRGYNEQQLDLEIQRALDITRETDLQPRNDQEKSPHIPLVVTYGIIHFAISGNNHQTTSKYPSYFGVNP